MKLTNIPQYLLPQHILSRFAAVFADCEWGWFKNLFIDFFIKHYHINMQEALESNPHSYASFNDFFTRKLKPSARPIATEKNAIASPADGVILQLGKIDSNNKIKAKGFAFTPVELCATNAYADYYKNGTFIVIYLAPSNYHRVHMPLDGKLKTMTHVPGRLFSVNPKIIETIPNVFARNERVTSFFNTQVGMVAVTMVGAMIVGSIETAWAGKITPTANLATSSWEYEDKNIFLEKGTELGKFKFGSTVILLFPEGKVNLEARIKIGRPVKMGELLGTLA